MDKRISDMNMLGTPDDSDYMEVLDSSEILPNNSNKKMTLLTLKNWVLSAFNLPQHKNTHVVGGTDAFSLTDIIDAVARFRVKLGNVITGTRRGINFIPGSNITITTADDILNDHVNVTINATGAGSGDVTDGSNLGGQNEVFVNKTTGILNFRTIEGTGATSVSTVGNIIQINTPTSTGEANTMSNVGTGLGTVFRDKIGVNFNMKTINAGSNVTITNNPDDITISTTAQNNQGVNIGGSVEVYAGMSGANLQFRTLQGNGSVTVNQVGDNIVINSNVLAPNIVNVGGGTGLFKNVIGNNYNFKTLTLPVMSGLLITENTDTISIQNEYVFNDRWLSNPSTNKLVSSFLQSATQSTILTSSFNAGNFLSSLTASATINGNFNSFATVASLDIINTTGTLTFINCRFVLSSVSLNEALMTITSGQVYFKNCTFYNNHLNNAPNIILNGNANVIFEDCYFVGNVSTTRTAEYLRFIGYTGQCTFKNCIIGANDAVSYTYCMTSTTPINVQLLGTNYARIIQDPNITFTIETLTVEPGLTYLTLNV